MTPAEPAADEQPAWRLSVKDVLCVGPIILNSIYYYAGLPLNAIFIGTRPVLLSALRGSIPAMVALGPIAVLQYAWWLRRRGKERTTWEYLQAEPLTRLA